MLAAKSAFLVRSPMVYAFGPFRLDPERGLLTYGSEVVPLPQRLVDILRALVEANGTVVSREVLHAMIWPERGVPENNLSQHVYMLRRALGERAGDRLYIATVHNLGFRFVAPVTIEHPSEQAIEPAERQAPDRHIVGPGFDAFRRYSKGFQSLERGMAADLRAAIEHFEAVLHIDADYVPALVALARSRLALAQQCYTAAAQQSAKAKLAVTRALQLEPACGDAHAVLSNIVLFFDWNWRDAKRQLDTAVGLNPENTAVRAGTMWLYEWIGQPDRAVVEAQRAVMAHPSSPALQMLLGRALIVRGDYNGAFEHFTNLMETHPEYAAQAQCRRAQALILGRQPERAILDLQFLPEDRAEDLASRLPLLGQAYADDGQHEKAEHVYEMLVNVSQIEYVAQSNLIALALSIGRTDAALAHLEVAIAQREPAAPLLRHEPRLAPIRKSDAFKSLVGAMGS